MNKRLAAGVVGFFAFNAAAASAATTSCSTVAACVFGSNTSSGIGVEGSSKTGVGVTGTSTSGFGISGISASNHGVNGTSITSFGVVGITKENATSAGTARAGVLGQDSSTNKKAFNSGVAGTSLYGFGGSFTSQQGIGLYASSAQTYRLLFVDGFNGVGDGRPDIYAPGFVSIVGTNDGINVAPSGGGMDPSSANHNHAAIRAYANYDGGDEADNLFIGVQCANGNIEIVNCSDVASIDGYGNATFDGTVTQNGSAQVRTRSSTGVDVASYGSRSTAPTIEDLGKGALHSGAAYVALETGFASTIDASAGYMVFITPEGNSHGLYTTQLTSHGFAVRENDFGKSSLVFDYRIVAHPSDTKKARLAIMPRPMRYLKAAHKNG